MRALHAGQFGIAGILLSYGADVKKKKKKKKKSNLFFAKNNKGDYVFRFIHG